MARRLSDAEAAERDEAVVRQLIENRAMHGVMPSFGEMYFLNDSQKARVYAAGHAYYQRKSGVLPAPQASIEPVERRGPDGWAFAGFCVTAVAHVVGSIMLMLIFVTNPIVGLLLACAVHEGTKGSRR